jgi:hypothetical protein
VNAGVGPIKTIKLYLPNLPTLKKKIKKKKKKYNITIVVLTLEMLFTTILKNICLLFKILKM